MIALETAVLDGLGKLDARAERFTGVQVDSRRIGRGDLFVAVGRGSEHCADAFERGAAATLLPTDPFAALAQIGAAVRDRSVAKLVGITGSMGKTSTKDILAALLRPHRRTHWNRENFNTEIGVPLSLPRRRSTSTRHRCCADSATSVM